MIRWQGGGSSHHALQNTLGLKTGALRASIIVAMEGVHKRMYWDVGLSSRCDATAATRSSSRSHYGVLHRGLFAFRLRNREAEIFHRKLVLCLLASVSACLSELSERQLCERHANYKR